MSIQLNPNMRPDATSSTRMNPVQIRRADERMISTIRSLNENDSSDASCTSRKACCFTTIFQRIGDFFKSIYGCIKDFCCGKGEGAQPMVKTDLDNMRELLPLLEKADNDTILTHISKLTEAKRNELYKEVYIAKAPTDAQVSDRFGEEEVNKNPRDAAVAGAIKGYVSKQERVIPLEDFLKVVEDGNLSLEEVLESFNALPTDVVGKNLQKEIKYAIWEIKGKGTDQEHVADFGMMFLEKAPHDEVVKQAVQKTISRM